MAETLKMFNRRVGSALEQDVTCRTVSLPVKNQRVGLWHESCQRALLEASMNLLAPILRTAVILMFVTLGVFAQDSPRIPLKDIVIYLDNSGSIVNTRPERPSLPLAKMLMEALSSDNSILTDNDTVSIYNFGPDINAADSRIGIAGRERETWTHAIERFRADRPGDRTTNLIKLFNHMANLISQPAEAGRLRVVIIASDFEHDAGGTSAQVLSAIGQMDPSNFTGSDARSFLFLLRIPKGGESDKVVARLRETLRAQVLYQERMNGSQLVNAIFAQITRWVELRVTGITKGKSGAPALQIQVNNPNSFSVRLSQIGIAHGNGSPQFIDIPEKTIIPGESNSLELDTQKLGREVQQDSLILYPGQSPAPGGAAKGSRASNMSWAQIDIESIQATVLGVQKKIVSLKAQVGVTGGEGDRLELRFHLKRGTERYTPLGQQAPLRLRDGSGHDSYALVFDGAIAFDHLTEYSLVVSTSEETPRVIEEALASPSYPGWVSLVLSGILLLILLVASKVAALGKGVDRLLVLGGLLFLVHVVAVVLVGPALATAYAMVFGSFIGTLAFLAMLRILLIGFETYQSNKAGLRLLTPELIARFVLWRLVFSVLVGVATGFLIAHYVL